MTGKPPTPPKDLSGHLCPNCGAPILPHETACKFCGEQLTPFFAPQVKRARRGGMERGMLFAVAGCGGLVVLAIIGLGVLFIVALVSQGGNSENDYSCSPGPCADAPTVNMRITRISSGDLTSLLAATSDGRRYLRFNMHADVTDRSDTTVTAAEFGLLDRARRVHFRVSGFAACPSWTDLPLGPDGSALPPLCFAVDDTDPRHYRMTWTRLKPGQSITLYTPKGN